MSVFLKPENGEDIHINVWNWVGTLRILDRHGILPPEQLERMRHNGAGGRVAGDEAQRIADFLDGYLGGMKPGQRVLWDGSITDEPITGELFFDEPTKNYSARFEWLDRFREFCRRSGMFEVL